MLMSPTSAQSWSNQYDDQTDPTFNSFTSTSPKNPIDLNTPEYLSQLLKDRAQLAAVPYMFLHVERLIDQEISNVRANLFNIVSRPKAVLPKPMGEKKIFQEKVYVPVKQYPDYNFVGRILGPRGLSAKQFEVETGCKIIVRGRGSFRDKRKEEETRGKPNYEHLNEDLHVILQCEEYENRGPIKLKQGKEELDKLLIPPVDGEDQLKRKQLTELAIIKGTYRDPNTLSKHMNSIPIGAPLILTQDLLTMPTQSSLLTTIPQNSILSNGQSNFFQIFAPFPTAVDQMGNLLTNETQIFEYANPMTIPTLTPTNTSTNNLPANNNNNSLRYQPYKTSSSRHNR